jgi:hypothetical protein
MLVVCSLSVAHVHPTPLHSRSFTRGNQLGHSADDTQTTGLSLPLLLAHAALIQPAACWMSIAGGGLVYGTILIYSGWFGGSSDDEF